jgi:hypothetical protein
MEPMSWMAIASTAVQAMGAIHQGNAAAASANAQAATADYNATVSRQQADSALGESSAAQMAQNRKWRQIAGKQRAAAAQSGVGFGGSNADILEQSETLAELDQLTLAYEGTMRARAFNSQGQLDEFSGGVYRNNARNQRTAGFLNAGAAVGNLFASNASPAKITPKSVVPAPSMSLNGSYSVYG